MNNVTRYMLLAVASVLCLPLNSPAQEEANSLEIFGQFGGSFLTDLKPDTRIDTLTLPILDPSFRLITTSERSIGNAGRYFGGFRWYVQKGRAFEVSFSFSNNRFWTRTTIEPDPPSPFLDPLVLENSGQIKFREIAFNYVQYLKPLKSWEPYFTAGLGLGVNEQGGGTIILGAGADYRLNNHFKLRFDFRNHAGVGTLPGGAGSLGSLPGSAGSSGIFHNLVPSIGLVYARAGPKAPSKETGETRFDVFVQGGPSFMTGKTTETIAIGDPVFFTVTERTSFTTSGRLFTGFRYYLTPENAIEVSHFFSRNRFILLVETDSSIFPSSFLLEISNDWVDGGAINLVHYLTTKGNTQWFITSGIGISFFNFGSARPRHELATNFGGGVDIPLSDRLSLRMEMRDWILQKPLRPGLTHNLTPSAGLAWRF